MAFRAFREPPWNDDLALPRLHFGLGIDLMRRNARLFMAKSRPEDRAVGYLLGYEILRTRTDSRDLTLAEISGSRELDALFDDPKPLFYWDTLCVDPDHRRQGLARGLALAMIRALEPEGFRHIARTSVRAAAMRRLFSALTFRELSARDARFPERSYWLLSPRPTGAAASRG